LQKQNVQLTGNPPGDFGLDPRQVFWLELVPTCPQILTARRVADPHVDP